MKWSQLKQAGHFPTLVTAFLYFDYSFMVWTLLGALGAQIAAPESLALSAQQKGLMVAFPILSGAVLRILLGLLVDRIGAKNNGIFAQLVVMTGLATAWLVGLKNFEATLLMGAVLGFAGASFAVALPQVGRWYPPNMQGLVLGVIQDRTPIRTLASGAVFRADLYQQARQLLNSTEQTNPDALELTPA